MSDAPPLRRELAGGYAVLVLNVLVTLLLVPLYLRLLGAEHWGIVALCLTLQGALFALDAMLAPPLLRDIAVASADGNAYAVYRRYLRLYGAIALGLFVAGQATLLLLPTLAALPRDALVWPLRLVLVQFLFQFCNNAAIGYWNGRLQQPYANRRLAVALLAKHAAALTLLLVWRADPLAWLLPFAVLGALEFGLNAYAVRRDAPVPSSATPPASPPGVPAYALAALLGLFGGQVDRLVLSLYLPAVDYGRYFLASTVVLSLLQLQVPLLRSFLPRLTTAADPAAARRTMLNASLLLVALPSLLIALAAGPVMQLWLRDAAVAAVIAPWLSLMLPAVAVLALYAPFGALLLAQGRYGLLTRINALALLAQVGVLAAGVTLLGPRAGGFAWLACALVQLAFVPLILRREPVHE